MPFIPHTDQDVAAMLQQIGIKDTEQLFDEIPADLRIDHFDSVPDALGEAAVIRLMRSRAAADGDAISFIGAGAYEHHIPAVVWDIATRGEFYSAYTPYQAEASQGTLQVIYEYQSMMAGLTGLDVANASLYDGATAFAEACLMAVRANRKSKSRKILVSRSVHPVYRQVAAGIVRGQGIELVELSLKDGCTDLTALKAFDGEDFAAICIQQPTFLGTLEDVDALTNWAHERTMFVVAICNPMTLSVLTPPGLWGDEGADIACGEGQPMGIPVSSGGPYFGYMVCRQAIVRQMPGRIVGRTVDLDGKPGFTLTLQAREQHIRRSKATSNICTNQGLMVTAATIYMSLLGSEGLRRTALQCHENTRSLAYRLAELEGISVAYDMFFHEAVLQLDRPVQPVIDALSQQNILAGYDLSATYPELGNALLVCATDARTEEDMDLFVAIMTAVLGQSEAA
ncbi:MAG: aminomethyl-transferring glycine dehydrogenase subunit GcvPA [Gammaproteobacteria bacterium]|nr:aminomethyl-transferring glycine dehydrogenase subunit GcvPA [Gammaproteobacteria bacterium]